MNADMEAVADTEKTRQRLAAFDWATEGAVAKEEHPLVTRVHNRMQDIEALIASAMDATEKENQALRSQLDDARSEAVALRATKENLRAQLAAQEQEITQAESVMDKQDEVIGELRARIGELERTLVANEGSNASQRIELRARLAELEAAAREGPSDAVVDAIIDEMGGRIWEYSYNDAGKPYLVNRNELRASVRAALATPATEGA
jgi:chromosome segregation ATPase